MHSFFLKMNLTSTLLVLMGCGGVTLGGGTGTQNDPVPDGSVVVQGNFQSQNSQTVSGAAIIYSMGGTSYIARLSGLTAPTETGLQVQVWANGSSAIYKSPLQSVRGNQNYTFTYSTQTFNQVCIYSTQRTLNYGCALLQ